MRETEHHRCISHLRHNPTASGSRRFVAPCNTFDLDAIDEQSLSWCNWLPVPRRRRPVSFPMHIHPRSCLCEASQLVRFFSIELVRSDSADYTWAADPTSMLGVRARGGTQRAVRSMRSLSSDGVNLSETGGRWASIAAWSRSRSAGVNRNEASYNFT